MQLSNLRTVYAFLAQSELSDWLLDAKRPEGCHLESFEPLLSWVVVIEGPDAAPGMPNLYTGERFRCYSMLK